MQWLSYNWASALTACAISHATCWQCGSDWMNVKKLNLFVCLFVCLSVPTSRGWFAAIYFWKLKITANEPEMCMQWVRIESVLWQLIHFHTRVSCQCVPKASIACTKAVRKYGYAAQVNRAVKTINPVSVSPRLEALNTIKDQSRKRKHLPPTLYIKKTLFIKACPYFYCTQTGIQWIVCITWKDIPKLATSCNLRVIALKVSKLELFQI